VTVLVWALLGCPPSAWGADNAALGGIGGINNGTLLGGDGTGQARISLFSVNLALVKQARDPAGTVLPDMAPVSPGQRVYFLLYVDNPTVALASDLRVTDPLDESRFTYLPGTLEQTLVPSGSSDAAIWAGSWTPLTDAVGAPDDGASATDTGGPPGADRITAGAVPGQANTGVGIPAATLWAIRFQARVN
jgi:hypothetical protein